MVAHFLHYFPQYSLEDLRSGVLGVRDFQLLYAGMVDNVNPDATDPESAVIARRVAAAHSNSAKRGGW